MADIMHEQFEHMFWRVRIEDAHMRGARELIAKQCHVMQMHYPPYHFEGSLAADGARIHNAQTSRDPRL